MGEHPELHELESVSENLIHILDSNSAIPEQEFRSATGRFSSELNRLLRNYAECPNETKDRLRPYINYYRQVQNYLVFLLRFETILQVPHHSEIQQTLYYLAHREELIEKIYRSLSEKEKELMTGRLKQDLEKFYGKTSKSQK